MPNGREGQPQLHSASWLRLHAQKNGHGLNMRTSAGVSADLVYKDWGRWCHFVHVHWGLRAMHKQVGVLGGLDLH